jgi:hypothetical protein
VDNHLSVCVVDRNGLGIAIVRLATVLASAPTRNLKGGLHTLRPWLQRVASDFPDVARSVANLEEENITSTNDKILQNRVSSNSGGDDLESWVRAS